MNRNRIDEARLMVERVFTIPQRDALYALVSATLETELSMLNELRKLVDEVKRRHASEQS